MESPNPSPSSAGSSEEAPVEGRGAAAIDTHCHLFLVEHNTAEVIAAARVAGVDKFICVGIDHESSRRSLDLAESYQGVFASAGVHPHTASEFDGRTGSAIEELLADPLVVAVGETGLDFYRRLSPPEDQRRVFRVHIALARESGKPLIVHVRDAWEDALEILGDENAERVVLHCFSGDDRIAEETMARGYFVSFAGNLTYPKADSLRRAATTVEATKLLVETDSPFLPPQSRRGSENQPSNLLAVLSELAGVRKVNLDSIIRSTADAARVAFPLLP